MYEDHLAKRQQDTMIMKTAAVEIDDNSEEDDIVDSPPSKNTYKYQRAEINSLSISSSKSSMNSPISPKTLINPSAPKLTFEQ